MKALAGFRELYPEQAAWRHAMTSTWRRVAKTYGFEEYDGPTLEPLELYAKKNAGGEEILGQLYRFEDGGQRQVALRPEMTPTLARMAAAKEKHYRKPMKWFAIGNFFRFERQQRGRLREFIQLNCDILGEPGPEADAELAAFAIDLMRAFGLGSDDFVLRLSHRGAWSTFLESKGISGGTAASVLQIVDKLEREEPSVLETKLANAGLSLNDLRSFISGPVPDELVPVLDNLNTRGLGNFVEVDLSIVRGLAYYTGIVFEIFDKAKSLRALAGGGRYDGLVGGLSEGAASLPAVGFGMGDVVLGNLIEAVPAAAQLMKDRMSKSCDAWIVIADESRRGDALRLLQTLRDAGLTVDHVFTPAKVGKQFQAAELAGAKFAIVVGSEWPEVNVKRLATREEQKMSHDGLAEWIKTQQL